MADYKISDLSANGTLTDADLLEIEQPGETAGTRSRKMTLAAVLAWILGKTHAMTAAINEARATAIASASTCDIGAVAGNFVHITGTTTITAFGTVQAGTERTVVFDGALVLTYNETSLILPTGADITTAAGDTAVMRSEGSGNWRCVSYQRASGAALAGVGGGSGLTLIGSATAGAGGSATLSVGSIPGTYSALWIVYNGRGTFSASGSALRLKFNGSTGFEYDYERFDGMGSTVVGAQTTADTAMVIGYIPAASAPSNRSGAIQALCPNYANTTFDKMVTATFADNIGSAAATQVAGAPGGTWRPGTPVAITSVEVALSSGNHAAGSKLLVYGLP